ncbi:SMC-Scp complex subunit ScpB [Heliorestis convoluta]|uniref:Segregation and condensation protein B n=1 Tax=Heliorestis convoluta TaxID=356322 RepID=A0A5Q2N634_9FIRM|nr:SMC-Scp complex subunit ScpB [Heliorestis convoluta]QGG49403.1 SMC-Scp complex subunit ScpB [Heliorestis convoluta]
MDPLFVEDRSRELEALLFVSPDPVPLDLLSDVVGLPPEEIEKQLKALAAEYDQQRRGWQLEEVAGGYRLATRPEYSAYVMRFLKPQGPQGLSKAALETLAIIAYHQPVTRAEIEEIRGVKADRSLATLLGKKLIQEKGRKEALGRPILYGTTDHFLRHFGLRTLEELPSLDEVFVQPDLTFPEEQERNNEGEPVKKQERKEL